MLSEAQNEQRDSEEDRRPCRQRPRHADSHGQRSAGTDTQAEMEKKKRKTEINRAKGEKMK